MLITTISVTDYKRVRRVEIKPDADRHLILIGGQNGAGKSSTLDAITAAFGGARAIAADPVRHGASEAAIFVELDGGKLTIDRVIDASGKTTLEVRDEEGAVRKPQEVLDRLVGARFLDPLAFLRLSAKDQRAQLMRLIPDAARLDELAAKRQRAFDRRTEIGRDLQRAKGALARLPEPATAGTLTPIDVAALNAEVRALADQQRAGDGLGAVLAECERETLQAEQHLSSIASEQRKIAAEIERLKARQIEMGIESAALGEDVDQCRTAEAAARAKLDAAAAAWEATAPRRAQLDADMDRADAHNRAVFQADAEGKRRADAEAAAAKLESDYQTCTTAITTIDDRRAAILAAAPLPVVGLVIGEDGLLLAGVPFAQASASEQLRVALSLAIAGSPELNDVWIRDGALLDDESLELVARHAAAAGKRVWIERVGERDPGVIVIQDGQVRP